MIGIILPTRGLVFTKVEEAIERERNSTWEKTKVFRSHSLKIPDAYNILVEEALEEKDLTHLWFVEEDTVPPQGALLKLVDMSKPIACIDYGVNGWSCVAKDKKGEILWCGLGCTMIRKEVFYFLEKPWFRADRVLRLNDWTWQKVEADKEYGGHDIYFFLKAREARFEIAQVEGECEHLKLDELGQREMNDGLHQISPKLKIEKYQIIEKGVDNYAQGDV